MSVTVRLKFVNVGTVNPAPPLIEFCLMTVVPRVERLFLGSLAARKEVLGKPPLIEANSAVNVAVIAAWVLTPQGGFTVRILIRHPDGLMQANNRRTARGWPGDGCGSSRHTKEQFG